MDNPNANNAAPSAADLARWNQEDSERVMAIFARIQQRFNELCSRSPRTPEADVFVAVLHEEELKAADLTLEIGPARTIIVLCGVAVAGTTMLVSTARHNLKAQVAAWLTKPEEEGSQA